MFDSKLFKEKRRAVRVAPSPDIQISVKKNGAPLEDATISDLSTMGIGLKFKRDPGSEPLKVLFHSPQILAGLEITGQIRNKREVAEPSGEKKIFVGLEYVFQSSDQQSLLLRWFTTYLNADSPQDLGSLTQDVASPYGADSSGLSIHFPVTQDELEHCFYLLQPLTIHHALIQSKFFAGFHKDMVTGVVPLIVDTMPFKLPADRYIGVHLDHLRSEHRRIGEIESPKFNEDSLFLKGQPSMILRKLHILFSLFLHLILYAKSFAQITDLVVLVPPQLQEFYRLWLFKEIRNEEVLKNLGKDPATRDCKLMHLDVKTLEEALQQKRPELLDQLNILKDSPILMADFQDSYFPSRDFLDKWFFKKKAGTNLTAEQKSYFQNLIPDLSFK